LLKSIILFEDVDETEIGLSFTLWFEMSSRFVFF